MDYEDPDLPKARTVADLRQRAEKQIEQLRAEGEVIQPVVIEGRLLARKFWGKAWCKHLNTFSDHENRLPRGRTYVRNGSVCHLEMDQGHVQAKVLGEYLYQVSIWMDPLEDEKWSRLKAVCSGQVGSLVDLLSGKLSDPIMEAVADPDDGLFPQWGEMKYSCDCPDYADVCKHIAAVFYAIGARLDAEPELLFHLRGVNHNDLVAVDTVAESLDAGDRSGHSRRRSVSDLSDVFGLDLGASDSEEA